MRRTATFSLCLLLGVAGATARAGQIQVPTTLQAPDRPLNQPPEGYVNLFNGKDLSGWRGRQRDYSPYKQALLSPEELTAKQQQWDQDMGQHWSVDADKGEIVSDGKGVYLTTDKDYGDFDLYVDWRIVSPNGDSGIYLRTYPQVQIWDPDNPNEVKNGAPKGSGGLFNNNPDNPGKWPLEKADNPIGQWNTFHIRMVGSRVWVWFNEKLTVDGQVLDNYFDRSRPVLPRGPIELQTHGSEIRFRNLYIKELASADANELLDKRISETGFESIFNGQDFTGWGGPIDEYEVVDGAIRCKPHKGGTIHTLQEYTDFEAKLEFKLPPGGNNGLAIHYPGTGDTAYVGECELQILDDTAPQYKDLDPRQFCCSVYGVVPAHTGYLRPVGDWNFEHVIIKGHTIKVELNGTVVIDTDVSTATGPFMHNSAHPGLMRTSGSFGFAGHDDPVAFRNIRIKKLGPE